MDSFAAPTLVAINHGSAESKDSSRKESNEKSNKT